LADDPVRAAEVVLPRQARDAPAARQPRLDDDPVARADPAHGAPGLLHDAGDVAAGRERQREPLSRDAPARPQVEVVQGARLHLEEDLVFGRLRIGRLLDPELLGPSVLANDDRSHLTPAPITCRSTPASASRGRRRPPPSRPRASGGPQDTLSPSWRD